MSVTAEIRRVALPAVKEGLETSCSNSGEGELLYGRLRRQGLNPRLATAIPAPERFGTSRHYPLYVTNSPFVKQVRGRGGAGGGARAGELAGAPARPRHAQSRARRTGAGRPARTQRARGLWRPCWAWLSSLLWQQWERWQRGGAVQP